MAYNTRNSAAARTPLPVPSPGYTTAAEPAVNISNNSGTNNRDPATYTQPAYSTQPGYTTQPPAKAVVQGGQEQLACPINEKEGEARSGGTEDANNPEMSKRKFHGQRPWFRKTFNMRVSKKIRKRRQNAKLRHILTPKNAMMVLHELHPELKIVATEQLNAANQMVYTVDIEIEGKTYRGHGMSKLAAKQAGCENALKAVLLEKMAKSNIKVNHDENTIKTEDVSMAEAENIDLLDQAPEGATSETASVTATENSEFTEEGAEGGDKSKFKRYAEDDVPWGSLASFALYKLFSEWQAQGYQLPATATCIPPVFTKMPGFQMAPMKKIPDDASKKHPVQLLNQLRPGSQYSETREGTPPNLTFTFTVVVDGVTYQGFGTSKKDAKKECAKSALEAMGVKYD